MYTCCTVSAHHWMQKSTPQEPGSISMYTYFICNIYIQIYSLVVQPVPWKMRLEIVKRNANRNPEWWGDFRSTSPNQENQISRCLTVQSRIEIFIGFEFRGILRYKFKLRFLFNLNLQLTKISPPFRISICILFTISSFIFQGTGCIVSAHHWMQKSTP